MRYVVLLVWKHPNTEKTICELVHGEESDVAYYDNIEDAQEGTKHCTFADRMFINLDNFEIGVA